MTRPGTSSQPQAIEPSRVHWWLAAEPLGDDMVWALTRVSATEVTTGPEGAGLVEGLADIRALAEAARPSGERDLWSGPMTDRRREHDLAVRLGLALLPDILRTALARADPSCPDTVTVAVRGWLARVPWDSLAIDERGIRLVEVARVLGGLPATLHVGRARLPDPAPAGPPVRVVDPGPSVSGVDDERGQWRPIYPEGRPPAWDGVLTGDAEFLAPADGEGLTPADLSALLTGGAPARLTYFGHAISGEEQAPAAAGLVLVDDAGRAKIFTAFEWLAEPDRFPAPPRVAVIGCGSDDSAVAEQSGLPIAAINAGAGIVTATRWILPLDPGPGGGPTTALAVAIDGAHGSPDPVDALRTWQLERLRRWRRRGEPADTPLLWAALVTYLAPARR